MGSALGPLCSGSVVVRIQKAHTGLLMLMETATDKPSLMPKIKEEEKKRPLSSGEADSEAPEAQRRRLDDEKSGKSKESASEDKEKAAEAGSVSEPVVSDAVNDTTEGKQETEDKADVTEKPPESATMGALAGTIDLARQQFPERLLALLEEKTCPEALYWLVDGDKFAVVPENFGKRVLDPFFQGTKFESFTRKLNRWGYKRVVCNEVPEGTLVYFHPDFRTGNGEKVKNMRSGRRSNTPRKLPPTEPGGLFDDRQPALPGLRDNFVSGGGTSPLGMRAAGLPPQHQLEMVQNARIREALLASQQPQPDLVTQLRALQQEEALRRISLERQMQEAQLRMDRLAEEHFLMNRLLGSQAQDNVLGAMQSGQGVLRGSGLDASVLSNASMAARDPRDALFLQNQLRGAAGGAAAAPAPEERPENNAELLRLLLLDARRKEEERQRRNR